MKVEVLGTKFNVNTYGINNTTVTTLFSGLIKIKPDKNHERIVQPGMSATFNRDNYKLKIRKTNIRKVNSWIFNEFYFNNEKLKDLAARFERRYNMNIYFKDKKAGEYRISGSFKDETIEEIMENMRYIIPIEYSFKHNNIYIKSRTTK